MNLADKLEQTLSELQFLADNKIRLDGNTFRNSEGANTIREVIRELRKAAPVQQEAWIPVGKKDVEWVVNDIAELGVKIGNQFFWMYKGRSLQYGTADDGVKDGIVQHDDGGNMHWRPIGKREFGECCHPVNYKNPQLIGTVNLADSDDWQPLPAAPVNDQREVGADVSGTPKSLGTDVLPSASHPLRPAVQEGATVLRSDSQESPAHGLARQGLPELSAEKIEKARDVLKAATSNGVYDTVDFVCDVALRSQLARDEGIEAAAKFANDQRMPPWFVEGIRALKGKP